MPRGIIMTTCRLIAASVLSLAAAAAQTNTAIPRLPDGKPNLNGIWQTLNTANYNIQDHAASKGIPGGQGVVVGNEIPYQPGGLEKRKENFLNRATLDTESKCWLLGVPRITYSGHPFQIFQASNGDKVTILYEYAHTNRFVYTNNTPHPKGPIDWWMGDSRGHWEGNTLVVETTNFLQGFRGSDPETYKMVERITRVDATNLKREITFIDPHTWTKPWTVLIEMGKDKDDSKHMIFDSACHEGNYGLTGLLVGTRREEQAAANKK